MTSLMTDADDMTTHSVLTDTDDLSTNRSVLTDTDDLSTHRSVLTDTDDLATQDIITIASDLQKLLVHHDRSLQQIVLIDRYIARLTRQALVYLEQKRKGQALRILTHRAIANGIKFLYRLYRLRKWQQVQQVVTTIMYTLGQEAPSLPTPSDYPSLSDPETDQTTGISKTLSVVHSVHYRYD
ncbi:uncharacterized protein LOC117320345 [Pecten maximus]|uniref:uncharacterized protein LOC117320345 n=1 Tax=Pecten maximus TaxID=6579 RepID=UPI001458FF54|nr:uncharacterized protein LOC117320345 [Pecten maximus]